MALLLTDGRVLVVGGETHAQIAPDPRFSGEIYSPPYMSKATPRPIVTGFNNRWNLGTAQQSLTVDVFGNHISKVVLTRPASVTHSFDFDARYIELEFSAPIYATPQTVTFTVNTPHESWVPPGFYMLWIVESESASNNLDDLVPSEAKFVNIF